MSMKKSFITCESGCVREQDTFSGLDLYALYSYDLKVESTTLT